MTTALVALSLLLPYSLVMAQSGPPDPVAAAKKIVERMALVRGERVLLVGLPSMSAPLVPALRQAVRAAGGVDLGAVAEREPQPADWSTDFTRELARRSGDAISQHLQGVDVAVMMPGAEAGDPIYHAMQRVLQGGKGRTVHFHWAGAYDLSGTLQPTSADAARLYQRVLLETDYSALSAKQSVFETAMRSGIVHVTTPLGTDLRFRIGDRPVTRQDGDVSAARASRARNLIDREVELPAGAVRVAPIEESVDGKVAFPPTVWRGVRVERLVLTFAHGKVTDVSARVGKVAVDQELAAGGVAAKSFREFALGFNPLLAIPTSEPRWIPYYGYGAGVVRLSLGDNRELGGIVAGEYVRWNFFIDATVTVGNDVWVRDGKLVR